MQTIARVEAALLVFLVAFVARADDDERAKNYMVRSIKGSISRNVEAIIKQRDPFSEKFLTLKIQRSTSGKSRDTILAPLKSQGRESIDDGVKMYTFIPDQKTIIIQSSLKKGVDNSDRVQLLFKNYELESESGEQVAGRPTIMVEATSRYTPLGAVRYYFDKDTGFPLKKESVSDSGNETVDFEVTSISFPKSFDEDTFKIKAFGGVEMVNFDSSSEKSNAKTWPKLLGFNPSISPRLPYGFKVMSTSTSSDSKWRPISLRLSDGLQKAAVYQWVYDPNESLESGENRTVVTVGKVRVMVVGELSEFVRRKIAQAFASDLNNSESLVLPEGLFEKIWKQNLS